MASVENGVLAGANVVSHGPPSTWRVVMVARTGEGLHEILGCSKPHNRSPRNASRAHPCPFPLVSGNLLASQFPSGHNPSQPGDSAGFDSLSAGNAFRNRP